MSPLYSRLYAVAITGERFPLEVEEWGPTVGKASLHWSREDSVTICGMVCEEPELCLDLPFPQPKHLDRDTVLVCRWDSTPLQKTFHLLHAPVQDIGT